MNLFPHCSGCDKFALISCGRCRSAFYCGRRCQKRHWQSGGHRRECSPENALSLISDPLAGNQIVPRDLNRPQLSVFVLTWNMAGKSMSKKLWLKTIRSSEAWKKHVFNSKYHDVYCFTLQESPVLDGLVSALNTMIQGDDNYFTRKIIQTRPVTAPNYNQKLCIWARTSMLDSDPVSGSTATSIFRTSKVCFGKKNTCSKGSLLVKVLFKEFPDVTLIGSHFPFSAEKPDLGNSDRLTAHKKTLSKLNTLLLDKRSSFIFWAGDLNFRKTPKDQLVQLMESGTGFTGFREQKITFRETCQFKSPRYKHPEPLARVYNGCRGEAPRKKADGTFYELLDKDRSCYRDSPNASHCDRILYSATPDLWKRPSQEVPIDRDFESFFLDSKYDSFFEEEFGSSSDHNPVYATFNMQKTPIIYPQE